MARSYNAPYIVTLASNGNYWQANYYDADGNRHRPGLGPKVRKGRDGGLSRRQALKRCADLQAKLRANPAAAVAGEAPKLVDFIKRCVDGRSGLSKGSRYLYDLTGRFLRAYFGDSLRIDRISRARARDWRTALSLGEIVPVVIEGGERRERATMGETTVCNYTKYARAMFAEAVADDLIPFNPFDKLNATPPDPDKQWHYLAAADFEKLLQQCPSDGWKCLLALCRLAGLRRGEAVALPWSAVDWDKRLLTVYATKTAITAKNGGRRVVPIVPRLYDVLLAAFGRAPSGAVGVCGLTPNNLLRDFEVIRKRAGLTEFGEPFQTMRRGRAQDWSREVPMNTLAEWMGHGIEVAAKFYLRTTDETLAKVTGLAMVPALVEIPACDTSTPT